MDKIGKEREREGEGDKKERNEEKGEVTDEEEMEIEGATIKEEDSSMGMEEEWVRRRREEKEGLPMRNKWRGRAHRGFGGRGR